MIYLIESNQYLKIGYTKDISKRFKAYKLHNPGAKLLDSKLGIKKDESELHKLCKKYHYQGEGYNNHPDVKKIFENYTSIILNLTSKINIILFTLSAEIKTLTNEDKNLFEGQITGSKFKSKHGREGNTITKDIEEIRSETNLPEYSLETIRNYDEQAKFGKFVLENNPNKTEVFNIGGKETISVTQLEELKPNVSYEIGHRNNKKLIKGNEDDEILKQHLLDAEILINQVEELLTQSDKIGIQIKELNSKIKKLEGN